jgi:copper chaperone CopZ
MMFYLTFLFSLSKAQANENTEDIRVFVKGMVCSFCVQGVEKQFKGQKSVENIEVDLEDSLVSIWLKEGQELSNQTIDSLIKDSGYDVESIERFMNIDDSSSKEKPTEASTDKAAPLKEAPSKESIKIKDTKK